MLVRRFENKARANGWELVWKWEPQRPFPKSFVAQPLQLAVFPSRREALDEHKAWIGRQYGVSSREEHPKAPEWLKKTRIIFQVVIGETNGAIVHDYVDVKNLIEDLHEIGVPEETIIYIPDYNFANLILKGNNGPVICLWPENPLLGGEKAFREMVATAKKYRYHIMPHSSIVLLISEYLKPFADPDGETRIWHNPEWAHLKQWARLFRDGTPHVWPEAGPSRTYPYVVSYLNQQVPEVQEYYVEGHTAMLKKYGLDALYFDSFRNNNALYSDYNHPGAGAERARGEMEIIRQLYERNPGVLLSGECCTEEGVPLAPLWNNRLPLTYELMGDYVYTFDHTVEGSPIPQRYPGGGISRYEANALEAQIALTKAQPNNIPRLKLNYRDRGLDELTRRCIRELLALTEDR